MRTTPDTITVVVWLALLPLLPACTRQVRFIRADDAFREVPAVRAPPVIVDEVDQAQQEPYRAVGMVEVVVPADTPITEVITAAAAKGQEVGCELLVDARLPKRTAGPGSASEFTIRLVHGGTDQYYLPAPPPRTYSFVCAILLPKACLDALPVSVVEEVARCSARACRSMKPTSVVTQDGHEPPISTRRRGDAAAKGCCPSRPSPLAGRGSIRVEFRMKASSDAT